MKLSLVLPCYSLNNRLESLAIRAAQSYALQVDELIVSEDGGHVNPALVGYSDIYVYSAANTGFTAAVNRGWKLATGDYVIIANSDTWITSGTLKDLCIPDKVISPASMVTGSYPFCGAFFVVPRSVFEEYGMLDESMLHYYSDTDYARRVKAHLATSTGVTIRHDDQGSTYKTVYADPHKACSLPDEEIYKAKWGDVYQQD